MDISTIIMIVPLLMTVALILMVIRGFIENGGADAGNVGKIVAAFLVLIVSILLISNVADTTVDHEDYDPDTDTLTIKANIVEADSYPWDGYAMDVESLVINDGVTYIADGAFSGLTSLEYISIPESVENITSSVFGVTLKDYMDQIITEPEAGEYGGGNGVLYYADASLFTYDSSGSTITGLTDASALYLMLPRYNGETRIVAIGDNAFQNNAAMLTVSDLRESTIETIRKSAFSGCTSLTTATLSAETLGNSVFQGCTSLTTATLPNATTLTYQLFFGDLVLATVNTPAATTTSWTTFGNCKLLTDLTAESLTTIGNGTFMNCLALSELALPHVISIGTNAFQYCNAITSISFGASLESVQSNSFPNWTFYDSDGTTELDETVASNLAGYIFQGTASALIKVEPGRSVLTAAQTLKVQELTTAAAELEKTQILDLNEATITRD